MDKQAFIVHSPSENGLGKLIYMKALCGKHSISSADNIELVTCNECLKLKDLQTKSKEYAKF